MVFSRQISSPKDILGERLTKILNRLSGSEIYAAKAASLCRPNVSKTKMIYVYSHSLNRFRRSLANTRIDVEALRIESFNMVERERYGSFYKYLHLAAELSCLTPSKGV